MTIDGNCVPLLPENRGKGRCNHVGHQNSGESEEEFVKRVIDSSEQIDSQKEYILNLTYSEKLGMINNNENIYVLIDDGDWYVRKAVARQGYGLEKLVNDRSPNVRVEVTKQGYGLDKLVDDKNWFVRKTVTEQGYSLDKLANDKDPNVRMAVAEQGYG